MNHVKSDPLLRAATIVINVAMVVCAGATILLLIFIPISFLMADRIRDAGITVQAMSAGGTEIIMPLAIVIVALGFQFLRTLRRIVISVGECDPFSIVNANRLSAMAWLALIIQAVSIVAGLIGNAAVEHEEAANIHLSISGFTGVLVALVLFILARVFRVGADMRAELEGTV